MFRLWLSFELYVGGCVRFGGSTLPVRKDLKPAVHLGKQSPSGHCLASTCISLRFLPLQQNWAFESFCCSCLAFPWKSWAFGIFISVFSKSRVQSHRVCWGPQLLCEGCSPTRSRHLPLGVTIVSLASSASLRKIKFRVKVPGSWDCPQGELCL